MAEAYEEAKEIIKEGCRQNSKKRRKIERKYGIKYIFALSNKPVAWVSFADSFLKTLKEENNYNPSTTSGKINA